LAADSIDDTESHDHGTGVNAKNPFRLTHLEGSPPRMLCAVGAWKS
jgi:hypothetical protein